MQCGIKISLANNKSSFHHNNSLQKNTKNSKFVIQNNSETDVESALIN